MDTNADIREARLSDAEAIAAIYNQAIAVVEASMDIVPRSPAQVRRRMHDLGPREAILVLEKDGELIGWGIIHRYSPRKGYDVACETSVYLHPTHFRRGYGTMLKRELIARCRALGYHHLVAKVMSSNAASIEYNLKLGYEVVGVQREIGYIKGQWQNVTIMQLVLQDVPPYSVDSNRD